MPAAVELFSILRSNAALRQLFADILGVAPRLAATVTAVPIFSTPRSIPTGRSTTPDEIQARVASPGPEPSRRRWPATYRGGAGSRAGRRPRGAVPHRAASVGWFRGPGSCGRTLCRPRRRHRSSPSGPGRGRFRSRARQRSRRRPGGRGHGQVRVARDDRRLRSRSPHHLRLRSRAPRQRRTKAARGPPLLHAPLPAAHRGPDRGDPARNALRRRHAAAALGQPGAARDAVPRLPALSIRRGRDLGANGADAGQGGRGRRGARPEDRRDHPGRNCCDRDLPRSAARSWRYGRSSLPARVPATPGT